MKRIIAAITILIMLFSLSPSSDAVVSDKAEPLPDGSVPCIKGTTIRNGVKTAEYYSGSGELLFVFGVYAVFKFDGKKVECISRQYFRSVAGKNCRFVSGAAESTQNSRTEATASASGVFEHQILGIPIDSVTMDVSITCDEYGRLS
ncbi:MAG: hypothetical protein SO374_03710 [Eubacteriales bacterium]|nr:hypothetical protein [Christensenellaceae bacterium]MDY2747209.1 hypothetical protein [Eubacteriales bacterium]MCI6670125.1 hypothetical protein [Christensenellaceae bacterium]MDD6938943.1 hypothetical protein [Christensenellaceae bacterium]MDD7495994.1 hypothetical protein [Christensenellaceae bacterium]